MDPGMVREMVQEMDREMVQGMVREMDLGMDHETDQGMDHETDRGMVPETDQEMVRGMDHATDQCGGTGRRQVKRRKKCPTSRHVVEDQEFRTTLLEDRSRMIIEGALRWTVRQRDALGQDLR